MNISIFQPFGYVRVFALTNLCSFMRMKMRMRIIFNQTEYCKLIFTLWNFVNAPKPTLISTFKIALFMRRAVPSCHQMAVCMHPILFCVLGNKRKESVSFKQKYFDQSKFHQ